MYRPGRLKKQGREKELSPCFRCEDRGEGCHGRCEKYKTWKEKLEAAKVEIDTTWLDYKGVQYTKNRKGKMR